jgi:hypothetical protein
MRVRVLLPWAICLLFAFRSAGFAATIPGGYEIRDIGLSGGAFSRQGNGERYSFPVAMNAAGQVVGFSDRYIGFGQDGLSGWLFDGTSTREIGLLDPAHTRDDGKRSQVALRINGAGEVVGNADRFSGLDYVGNSAWRYDASGTREIGMTDGEHRRADGFTFNGPTGIGAGGHVIGWAQRFAGTTDLGFTSWINHGQTTREIGLTDAAHTRSNGSRFSNPTAVNGTGQVTGYSTRYNGATGAGRSAWAFDGQVTREIGLTDAAHTRSDGFQFNDVKTIDAAGRVVGVATRYSGTSEKGQSAWLYDGSGTSEIGLIDAAHTRSDGFRSSTVGLDNQFAIWGKSVNGQGQIIGNSKRYSGSTDRGQSAWLYDGGSTVEIGPSDAVHTRADGYRFSEVWSINEAGDVMGHASRFGGPSEDGGDGWFYDGGAHETVSIGGDRANGFAEVFPNYLSEDGLVLGSYHRFAGETDVGYSAFVWSRDGGMRDLGDLVRDGLRASGWESITGVWGMSANGTIVGQGTRVGEAGTTTFILVPVPEPAFGVGMAALALLLRRRR